MGEIRIFEKIESLDAEIRTIERVEKEKQFFVKVGLFESLGEQGGDILTLTFSKYPEIKLIKELVEQHLKEVYEDLKDSLLGRREETQLEAVKKILGIKK